MKILITSEWYRPVVNGVVRSILNLKKQLIKMGHEVKVLTMSPMFRSYKSGDVYYIASLSFNRFYPEARQAGIAGIPLIRELIRWKPDVIHSQTEFSSFFYARFIQKRTNAAHVHTYHTIYEDYTHYFSPSKRVGKFEAAIFTKKVLSKISKVITPTKKTKALLEDYGVKPEIVVVPTGLELEKFKKKLTASERTDKKDKLNIGEEKIVAIFLGRLAKEKNFEEVFSLIKNEKDIVFLIVGDGPYRDHLEKLSVKMQMDDRVVFTGMVVPEEVVDYYKIADFFVSASMSETQGLTYIEALASGLPVIARKDPCLEGVVKDGTNGFLYETDTEFYDKLNRFKSDQDLRNQMSKEAVKASWKFSAQNFAKAVFSVYEKAVIHNRKNMSKRNKK